MADKKKDNAGLAAGAAATGGGGLLLVKTIRKKKPGKVEEVVEKVVEKPLKSSNTSSALGKARKASRSWGGGSWFTSEMGNRATKIGSRFARKFHSEIENKSNMEKLFSTGNSDLDDILEEVYYSGIEDGYDYAYQERYYAENEDGGDSGAGLAAAGTVAGGGVYGLGRRRARKLIKEGAKEAREVTAEAGQRAGQVMKAGKKEAADIIKKNAERQYQAERNAGNFLGELVEKIGKNGRAKKAEEAAQNVLERSKREASGIMSEGVARGKAITAKAKGSAEKTLKKSKLGAAAVIGTGGALAIGKAIKNRKKSE